MSGKPVVVLGERLSAEAEQWLSQRCRVTYPAARGESLLNTLVEAHGLVVRTSTRVDERLLNGAPRLRVVGRAGVGIDHVDVASCRERGIEVVYTPDANTQSVVEFVLTVISNAVRQHTALRASLSPEAYRSIRLPGT